MKRYRFRLVIPAFPAFNIYSGFADQITALGAVCVGTAASKLPLWDVEIIDENNCKSRYCPKDEFKRPDHRKLQEERPADVIGFYCSLTSTMPRVYELCSLYKGFGVKMVAGGKHTEYMPEEAFANGMDVVVFRDGEETIVELLTAWEKNLPLDGVKGIAFRRNGETVRTPERPLISDFDSQPQPNFDLVRYAKIVYYPVGRIRGCNSNCEFCAVKDRTRCMRPEKVMEQVAYLAEHRKARKFFEVSDHFGADIKDSIRFCNLLAEYQKKKNLRLQFTVQIRLADARHPELLKAMREAGVLNLAIGYESPIDEELLAMNKGYLSKDMLDWTATFRKYGFKIHGMFIFGYPNKDTKQVKLTLDERIQRFKDFVIKAKLPTIQVLLTIPLPGTELRKRLEEEGRVYPLDKIGWEYYDGQFPLFEPDEGIDVKELQPAIRKVMGRLYRLGTVFKLLFTLLIHFPPIAIISSFSIFSFRVKYIVDTYMRWKKHHFRDAILRFGGYVLLKKWMRMFKSSDFSSRLEEAQMALRKQEK